MNSAQRRKIKRGHPYHIKIRAIGSNYYYEYDKKIDQAIKWCKKNCKGSFKCDTHYDHAVFKFSQQKESTIFAIMWI